MTKSCLELGQSKITGVITKNPLRSHMLLTPFWLTNGTLLDLICKGSTSWRKHKTLFSTWMSRTRFVAEHVLSQCSEVETAKETMSYLPEIEAEPFPGPRFDGGQAEKIAQKFERKRKSRS
jgi:hypothetical protein